MGKKDSAKGGVYPDCWQIFGGEEFFVKAGYIKQFICLIVNYFNSLYNVIAMKTFVNKNNNYRQHLILGTVIPVAGIFIFVACLYICFLFIKPKLDFLYIAGNNNNCLYVYSVKEGRLFEGSYLRPKDSSVCHSKDEPSFFVYDSATNISKKISLAEAQVLNLDSQSKSPDGYRVVYSQKYEPWPLSLFSKSSRSSYFLKGPIVMKMLYYGDNREALFIGWIK